VGDDWNQMHKKLKVFVIMMW